MINFTAVKVDLSSDTEVATELGLGLDRVAGKATARTRSPSRGLAACSAELTRLHFTLNPAGRWR